MAKRKALKKQVSGYLRSCANKVMYRGLEEVVRAKEQMVLDFGEEREHLMIYVCRYCANYHLGHGEYGSEKEAREGRERIRQEREERIRQKASAAES